MVGQFLCQGDFMTDYERLLLSAERTHRGASGFGYLLQGLFVHALLRQGGNVSGNLSSGHPDITWNINGGAWRFEVTTLPDRYFVDPEDLEAIAPIGPKDRGFLGFFDLRVPARWFLVPHDQALRLGSGGTNSISLAARSDKSLSAETSRAFLELVKDNAYRIRNLNFPLLREWADRGDVI